MSPQANAECVKDFGNQVTGSLVCAIGREAPPQLLAAMVEKFPAIIRDETEAFLANLQRSKMNGVVKREQSVGA